MKKRERVKNKFGGRCAYSGTPLRDDWQIDHMHPIFRNRYDLDKRDNFYSAEANMMPCQRIINHYKHTLNIEEFREVLITLHLRIARLPKNPRKPHTIRKKEYLLEVAEFFGIAVEKPWHGVFYFETL